MSQLPREDQLDRTLAFLADGYTFILNRCRRYGSDRFATRLMLQKAICIMGAEAAQIFYQPGRFTRRGAMPKTTLWLLQDQGSVATLDGAAHHHRKQMFMALLTSPQIEQLTTAVAEQWHTALAKWTTMDTVVLLDEVQALLCRAVCTWSGVPLTDREATQRTRELTAMIEGAGAVGPRNWRGMWLRRRTERWSQTLIKQVRARQVTVPKTSAIHVIAWHRELDGNLLDTQTAAVELLNILRPTVAVAHYIIFAALALHNYPACRARLATGDDTYLDWFVQEVRRFYPFFPFVGGRALTAFDWRGHHFTKDSWVLLDLYGTNHDDRIWEEPGTFRPERFADWDGNAFALIPQGGGDHETNHRCAGEWLTIALLKCAVHLLTTTMQYTVPPQDLRVRLSHMPAVPQSRFLIHQIQPLR